MLTFFLKLIPTEIRRDQRLMFADWVTDIRESALKMSTFFSVQKLLVDILEIKSMKGEHFGALDL